MEKIIVSMSFDKLHKGEIKMCIKVLIADDASFMRMMLKKILSTGDFEVVGEAENGKKAVEQYTLLKPDVATMDITMPELDGISALKEILKIDRQAKVIMCSAMGQQAIVIEAIKEGAKDFIEKPFQAERVIEAIKKAADI